MIVVRAAVLLSPWHHVVVHARDSTIWILTKPSDSYAKARERESERARELESSSELRRGTELEIQRGKEMRLSFFPRPTSETARSFPTTNGPGIKNRLSTVCKIPFRPCGSCAGSNVAGYVALSLAPQLASCILSTLVQSVLSWSYLYLSSYDDRTIRIEVSHVLKSVRFAVLRLFFLHT
jgi:hypothetical protein